MTCAKINTGEKTYIAVARKLVHAIKICLRCAKISMNKVFLIMWWTVGNIKHLTIYSQEEKKSHFSCQIWHFMCYVRLTCPQDHCLFDWARCVISFSFLFFNTLYSGNFSFWRSYYEIFSCLLDNNKIDNKIDMLIQSRFISRMFCLRVFFAFFRK